MCDHTCVPLLVDPPAAAAPAAEVAAAAVGAAEATATPLPVQLPYFISIGKYLSPMQILLESINIRWFVRKSNE